jgi:hypothetical protein
MEFFIFSLYSRRWASYKKKKIHLHHADLDFKEKNKFRLINQAFFTLERVIFNKTVLNLKEYECWNVENNSIHNLKI